MSTAANHIESSWPTLLGQGNAWIIGLPSNFNFDKSLKDAEEIRLATAFARRSGWQYLRNVASQESAKTFLLTGLDCWHTEPELLKEWYELMMSTPSRVEAKIAPRNIFFHPKVLIATSHAREGDFAIVGSGNLSRGGLCDNVECGVYVNDKNFVAQLKEWFDKQFDQAMRVTDKGIVEYTNSYKKNLKERKKLEEKEQGLRVKMEKHAEAKMREWDRAVKEAKAFFATNAFKRGREKRLKAAEDIRAVLKSPQFNFDKSALDKFFAILSLGKLIALQKPKIWSRRKRFQEGLRALIANREATLPMILERRGSFNVPGSSLNTISKILAAHEPSSWPVFNNKVKSVLHDFGYKAPRGKTMTGKYLAYKDLMKKFSTACGRNMDAFALDAFFFDRWKRLNKK